MSFNDPIAQLLTQIRNASQAKLRFTDVDVSKLKINVLKILKEKGFIQNYMVNDSLKKVRIFLKYKQDRNPVIRGLRRISSPGLRRYVASDSIPWVRSGIGLAIISTSKGLLDDATARKMRVGGEVLCYVW